MDWINISEKAPNHGDSVLAYFDVSDSVEIYIYTDLSKTEFAEYGKHQFSNRSGFLTDDITHWMPLPDPPTNLTTEG